MTTFDASAPRPTGDRLRSVLGDPRVALALIVLVTLVAYNQSLSTLASYLSSDTPIAYVALVPLLVLGVAVVRSAPREGELRLPHRHADWMIGIPLLAGAALLALVLPSRLSYSVWTNRLDLLGLPLFVAGIVAITLGARVLRRIALPLGMLLLAWPFPYERGIDRILTGSQQMVLFALDRIAPHLTGVTALGNATFRLGNGPGAFEVNVAPACAGASSGLGFLLVGGFALFLLQGSRKARFGWLAAGVLLTQVVNLLRLVALFLVGARMGRDIALDWLHPYLGLVLFVFTTLFMLLVGLRIFHLSIPERRLPPAADAEAPSPMRRLAGGRTLTMTALGVALALALVLGVANADLARFQPFSGIGGAQLATTQIDRVVPVAGMKARRYGKVDWIGQYFGKSAKWTRYTATVAGNPGSIHLDVQQVAELRTFERFGLEACYRFHGREIVDNDRPDIGYVVPAQSMVYVDAKDKANRTWALVSWVWPVSHAGEKRFERVVLLRSVAGTDDAALDRARQARAGLVATARSLVDAGA